MKSLLAIALLLAATGHAQKVYDDLDAVVIEADEDGAHASEVLNQRQARQVQLDLDIQPELADNLGLEVEKQPCLTGDKRLGRCTSHKECYKLFRVFDIKDSEQWIFGSYDTCGVSTPRGTQITGVCCPVEAKEPLPVVEDEEADFPIEFQQINKQCGKKNECFGPNLKIVEGKTACTNEFPFMAALLNKNRHFCGGSLIDKRHVLTAAHCVNHMSKYDVQNLRVRLGDHKLNINTETRHREVKVKRVIRHKGFDQKSLHSDIAILTLNEDITDFSSTIAPICLATNPSELYENAKVEVAGWGTTGVGKSTSNELRKVGVTVWTNHKCKNSYGKSSGSPDIVDSMVCANQVKPPPIKDSCSGDSGGPLYKCYGSRCEQVGIVSWGIGCAEADHPGVYTRVTSLLPWISKIVAKY